MTTTQETNMTGKYAIVQETPWNNETKETLKNWIVLRHNGFVAVTFAGADCPAPEDFSYHSREAAETDAEKFRAARASHVAENKILPSVFTVVDVSNPFNHVPDSDLHKSTRTRA
jgi:hypothetical protein